MTQDTRDSTNFPFELARRLANVEWSPSDDFLYYHQNIARIYFDDPKTRGLLIYHGTGMGKSMLAAAIAMDAIFPREARDVREARVDHEARDVREVRPKRRRVIILLAKSLASNMQGAISQYIDARIERGGVDSLGEFGAIAALPREQRDEWVRRNFSFVTMNASNMLSQMSRATFISEEDEDLLIDAKAKDLMGSIDSDLNGKLLIVDEAHNLFRAITNGSGNAANLYKLVMRAKNLKIAFLTGTPIANHPFELAVCFNMLAGANILPVQFEDFARLFIASSGVMVANREKFQNRIFGLVSFVDFATRPGVGIADLQAPTSESGETAPSTSVEREKQKVEFPQEIPVEIVRVPMDADQYNVYLVAREREKSEGLANAMRGGAKVKVVIAGPRFRARDTPALQKPKSSFSSSYRVQSRQLGNYCPPQEIRQTIAEHRGEIKDSQIAEFASDLISKVDKVVSPKFSAILERVAGRHKGQLGLIYSQFVGIGGLTALARFLDQNGYKDRYAIISGKVDIEERARIVAEFSDPSNMHADKIALLLVSSTGAEGIDLKNVRHVHILEPYWNYGRIQQVKARAIRNGSHTELPPEERNVASYIYVAVPPLESSAGGKVEPTSDEELYENSRQSQILISSFESAIKEVSIECALNHTPSERATHCRICAPSGQKLLTASIESDVLVADPCVQMTSKRIAAIKKVKVGDKTFAFKIADKGSNAERIYGFDVFEEDTRLRAWRHIPLNDERYAIIVAAITAMSEQK